MPQLSTIKATHVGLHSRGSPSSPCQIADRGAASDVVIRTCWITFCFFDEACGEFIKVEILLFKRDDEVAELFGDTVDDQGKFDLLVEGDSNRRKL